MAKEPLRPHNTITFILDRYVHCGSSAVSALRQTIARCFPKDGRAGFLKLPRAQRRFFCASVFLHHAHNASVYRDVLSGVFRDEPKNRYMFDTATQQVSIA